MHQDPDHGSVATVADIRDHRNPSRDKPKRRLRIALVGNFAPRKCGIATFTKDVCEQLAAFQPHIETCVFALDDPAAPIGYPEGVETIAFDDPQAYERAATKINDEGFDAVWLQHEYGIFGGDDGEMVCDFVDRLAAPLILTCHTVLLDPSARQASILQHLTQRSSRVMVMSGQSRDLLAATYGVRHDILAVIEHGAPDRPFGRHEEFKRSLGLAGRKVMMTFGLLGPGKGIEQAIAALPAIAERHPNIVYRIIGATHPNLVAQEGEAYRERLAALAEDLGVAGNVEWYDRFLDTPDLLDQLEACDVYITPYPNLQQSTSGTLSYAVALGKAVVSTPYVHARELLADDVGVLIKPDSPEAISDAVNALFDDPHTLGATQFRAYARGRRTVWPCFADAAARLVEGAVAPEACQAPVAATPSLAAVQAMSDGTGMLQHAIGVIPDRRHGYCLDDNARALMLLNVASGIDAGERMRLSHTYAAFVQDAWNPGCGRFRNFMRFDRSWCEEAGSEDSNGRAVWALGRTCRDATDPGLADWAKALYREVLQPIAQLESPRALAFVMLGASAFLDVDPEHQASREVLARGGDLLERLLGGGRRPDWSWFETVLGYDNPRLCQAMIEAGRILNNSGWIASGCETLAWICAQQRSAKGLFRPVGSESFGKPHGLLPFDQQPLEAQAAIEAAASAARASADRDRWFEQALAAWRWFFGANDRGAVLADIATGRCRDGITPRGANTNCGAESILAFHLSHYAMVALSGITDSTREGRMLEPARETRI
ncbi:glycosyltransferase family 4 protein [Novosphingobium aquimarinum]|uniref:glycosyltransferase family 4 protein n=1 Tax=Novosphingobium aquimarinum TaxID=2682494 RepID=UPI0012EB3C1F|nr:glycosyltransferase family 4 protein [Novosphingobium aquimarinum]